ncbi:hypothetical protein D3C71_1313610 [compost metagenome]
MLEDNVRRQPYIPQVTEQLIGILVTKADIRIAGEEFPVLLIEHLILVRTKVRPHHEIRLVRAKYLLLPIVIPHPILSLHEDGTADLHYAVAAPRESLQQQLLHLDALEALQELAGAPHPDRLDRVDSEIGQRSETGSVLTHCG